VAVFQQEIQMATRGPCDVRNITSDVARVVSASKISTGVVQIAGIGSTVGIRTLEFEPGCVSDLQRALEQIAPANTNYAHNERWGDENGYSHLRSALVGTTQSFPVTRGELSLGTWQHIVFCDFDDRPRNRRVVVTVMGE
jgi:secondary thiamine-phosphate synthase enzyme